METVKQKWINERGVLYPIPGYTTLYNTPGAGVFTVYQDPQTSRLGLSKLDDAFTFDFKVYDLGCDDVFENILKTWNSRQFTSSTRNLGVIFNGLKGTGKTISAKVISNRVSLPVVIVPQAYDGIQDFIASLCFECVVLIDEAEKTFKDHQECLLKLIDGVYNEARKLYIMTTNTLRLDENLLGRPGRVRYIKRFGNLSAKAVNDYVDDNLEDKSKKQKILELVDSLEISTIDILKVIVEETNIFGDVPSDRLLNVPRADFRFSVMEFSGLAEDRENELKEFVKTNLGKDETLREWLSKFWKKDESGNNLTNEERLEQEFDCSCFTRSLSSSYSYLHRDQSTMWGTVVDEPDKEGWFHMEENYGDHDRSLYCCLRCFDAPSLYRGGLAF